MKMVSIVNWCALRGSGKCYLKVAHLTTTLSFPTPTHPIMLYSIHSTGVLNFRPGNPLLCTV